MEKDIVERLRECRCAMLPNEYEDYEICDQAADEIERLRALVAELEDELKDRIIEEDLHT